MFTNSPVGDPSAEKRTFQSIMSRYQRSSSRRANWQIVNSIIPYLGLVVLMYFALQVSFWLTLGVAVLAAGFLIRIFIIFHDCGHGSFFKSRRANHVWGVITGILTLTPFYSWRQRHAVHHATSGDLDKRGVGDVWTMTIKEYLEAPLRKKIEYRIYRNPLAMHFLGPIQILLIQNRRFPQKATRRDRNSIIGTNLAILAIILVASLTVGIKAYALIQLPIYLIGTAAGIWLFYVQHQYEGVYWERHEKWDFISASLDGSSFYRLPKVLQWFSGNIGFHHIHHLDSRIPNYHLEKCHDEIVVFRPIASINFWHSLKSLNFRLWDEEGNRLVSFGHLRFLKRKQQTERVLVSPE